MDNGMEFVVKLQTEDYRRFNFWYFYGRPAGRALVIINAVLVLLIGILAWEVLYLGAEISPAVFLVAAFLPLVVFILMPLTIYFQSGGIMASDKFLQEEHRYWADENGIRTESVSSTMTAAWNDVFRAVELKGSFLVFIAANKALIIPKRCFAGEAEVGDFRELIGRNVSHSKRRLLK